MKLPYKVKSLQSIQKNFDYLVSKLGNGGISFSGQMAMTATAAAPDGWLLCNGAAVSRIGITASLFAAIGTTYGVGDGSTTFNIPDMRGRTAIGSGTGAGLTARTLGAALGTEPASMPSHNHGGSTVGGATPDHWHGGPQNLGGSFFVTGGGDGAGLVAPSNGYDKYPYTGGSVHSLAHDHVIGAQAAGGDNMQPSLVMNYVIKI